MTAPVISEENVELIPEGSLPPEPDTIPAPEGPPGLVTIDRNTEYSGAFLKRFRESKGISLKEIAETTRISVSGLKAVEAEDYDRLPNARIYVRGYVRCLALEVGLDPDLVARSYVPRWEAWFSSKANSKKPYNR